MLAEIIADMVEWALGTIDTNVEAMLTCHLGCTTDNLLQYLRAKWPMWSTRCVDLTANFLGDSDDRNTQGPQKAKRVTKLDQIASTQDCSQPSLYFHQRPPRE